MKDLIEKLEAATEGSRELDREVAVHPDTPSCGVVKGANINVVREAEDCDPPIVTVPCYTTSLDDALTLVPKGWYWSISQTSLSGYSGPLAFCWKHNKANFMVHASTPALALTIAALKAREVEKDSSP